MDIFQCSNYDSFSNCTRRSFVRDVIPITFKVTVFPDSHGSGGPAGTDHPIWLYIYVSHGPCRLADLVSQSILFTTKTLCQHVSYPFLPCLLTSWNSRCASRVQHPTMVLVFFLCVSNLFLTLSFQAIHYKESMSCGSSFGGTYVSSHRNSSLR